MSRASGKQGAIHLVMPFLQLSYLTRPRRFVRARLYWRGSKSR